MAQTNAITKSNSTAREVSAQHTQGAQPQGWSYRPPTDIVQTPEAYILTADVPGATQESIDLSVEDGVLTIQAHVPWRYPQGVRFDHQEYGVGDYHRRFRLGDDVDAENISAAYDTGVVTVTLPKRAGAQARRIRINNG